MSSIVSRQRYAAPQVLVRRNVLIVGPSGSGKSQVINTLASQSLGRAQLGQKFNFFF